MEPDIFVGTILKDYMSLPDDNIFFRDQNIKGPTDGSLFLVIGVGSTRFIGVKTFIDEDTNEDVQQASLQTTINIDIVSKNEDAKYRHYEIPLAMVSIPAQQLSDSEGMGVWRTSEALDISEVEGASSLHRFRYSVIVNSVKEVRKDTDQYFDKIAEPEVSNE